METGNMHSLIYCFAYWNSKASRLIWQKTTEVSEEMRNILKAELKTICLNSCFKE